MSAVTASENTNSASQPSSGLPDDVAGAEPVGVEVAVEQERGGAEAAHREPARHAPAILPRRNA